VSVGIVILLLELIRSFGLNLDCFGIRVLSLVHRAQVLVANVLTTLIRLPWLSDDTAGDCFTLDIRRGIGLQSALHASFDFTKTLLHSSFELLWGTPHAHFSCIVAFDLVNSYWISAHDVVVTQTRSFSAAAAVAVVVAVAGHGFEFLRCHASADSEVPWCISLKGLSEVHESMATHRCSHPLEIELGISWLLFGCFRCPMGFCLFCWLLESSFACSSALVSLWHHGFSVNVWFFLSIQAWKCCAHVLSSGRFLFSCVSDCCQFR